MEFHLTGEAKKQQEEKQAQKEEQDLKLKNALAAEMMDKLKKKMLKARLNVKPVNLDT